MSIRNDQELAVTRKKLLLLEEQMAAAKSRPADDAHVRELTLRSLKSMINQMVEEITRYTAKAGARTGA